MTYDEIVSQLKTLLTVELNDADANFTRIIPGMFLYADGRIYRELGFLAKKITQPATLTALNREFSLPPNVRVLRAINLMTPAGAVSFTSKRIPLERISVEALDFFWPDASFNPSAPQKYAVLGLSTPAPLPGVDVSYQVRLMPTPDKPYSVELLGDIRPDPLAPENPQTFLSVFYPELFIAACMIFGSGYQRDFGAQAEDPAKAVSWEAQYTALRQGVMMEAMRMSGVHEETSGAQSGPAG
jgi:hypothetical protein